MNCHCCSGPTKKFGRFENRNRLVQRYRCTRCGKTFSETQPLEGVRIDEDKASMVCQMIAEGVGIRAISRLTGLNKGTVLNVLETAGRHCEALLNAKLINLTVQEVQLDEIYGFVGCLQSSLDPENLDDQRGEQYTFLAVERNTKLIIHHEVGKRDGATTTDFLHGLKGRVVGRFQLTTDGFKAYCDKNENGVRDVFGDQVDYATEVKMFAKPLGYGTRFTKPVEVRWLRRTIRSGHPDLKCATINHVERTNLSVRLFNRRMTRKTICHSKIIENHRHATAIQIAHFNFCRVHSAIRSTPAVAQGLAERTWTTRELLTATI